MPRAGLSPLRVVEEAEDLADEVGAANVTLAAVAERLGVKLPSIYKHVAGADALRQRMAARAKGELAAVLARATVGRSGEEAVLAMCRAYRGWARRHPGRYELTVHAPVPGDTQDEEATNAVLAVTDDILAGYHLGATDAVDAVRGLRAVVHGFLDLERSGGFGLPVGTERSFDRLVAGYCAVLSTWGQPGQPKAGEGERYRHGQPAQPTGTTSQVM